ncbi:uncharacterized protein JCM10292_005058 [Rhodotorula paludigena]|uniref:uncharacterized protein n=1 Tax=Rhodotorula paludigena TaxID=86838 RepID=UPI0031752866
MASGAVCADDNSLQAALGGDAASPSPWSRFLTPSLFTPAAAPAALLPAAAAAAAPLGPSPLKEAHQPGLFTHAKEINPFERSFAVVDPAAVGATVSQRDIEGLQQQHAGARSTMRGGLPLELPQTRNKRKRAASSPAVATPGGSGLSGMDDTGAAADFLPHAKRPALRLLAQDSGIGLPNDSPLPFAASGSTYSLRSSAHNSFDSTTGSSLLRSRRGQSVTTTDSPDTSIAASPPSPKLGASTLPPASSSTFAHFQPQPAPFTMPPVTTTAPYADPALLAAMATTLAPASVPPLAVAPLPFASQPLPFDSISAPLDPLSQYAPFPHVPSAFAAPLAVDPALAGPVPPGLAVAHPSAPLPPGISASNPLAPAVTALPPNVQHPPIPIASLAPSSIPLAPPQPPVPAPAGSSKAAKGGKKGAAAAVAKAPAAAPAPPLAASTSSAAAQVVPTAAPAAPTKPPGKKRGRKPKNWDPTLETTIELDPEEQERQRKLALERNRVAASKSRRRKKERVEALESASTDLCTRNLALQAECRNLLAEVHSLRTYLAQVHPEQACQCHHIVGYVARERDGGGIPAILYGAGQTLERDYANVPKWGKEDDVFSNSVETSALEALAAGTGFSAVPGLQHDGSVHPDGELDDLRATPPSPHAGAKNGAGGRKAPVAVDEEDMSEESEEETFELKSRRARAITARNK